MRQAGQGSLDAPWLSWSENTDVGRISGVTPSGARSATDGELSSARMGSSEGDLSAVFGARADMTAEECVRTRAEAASAKRAAHAAEAVRYRNTASQVWSCAA